MTNGLLLNHKLKVVSVTVSLWECEAATGHKVRMSYCRVWNLNSLQAFESWYICDISCELFITVIPDCHSFQIHSYTHNIQLFKWSGFGMETRENAGGERERPRFLL